MMFTKGNFLKHLLLIGIIVIAVIVVLTAMGSPLSIASVSSSGSHKLSSLHWYLTANQTRQIHLSAGEELTLNSDISTKKGDLAVQLNDENGSVQFAQSQAQDGAQTFCYTAEKEETLTLSVLAKEHRGSYKITWSVAP